MARAFLNGINLAGQKAVNLADPSAGTDAVNLQTLQNYVGGLAWKEEVRVATTVAGTLASDFEDGDTVDGVVLATGDRILVKNQADAAENGIRIVAATGAPARSLDANTTAKLNNATVSVTEGTTNEGRIYTQTTPNPVVDTDDIDWAQFAAGVAYTADGEGIVLVGNEFQLDLDGTSLSKSGSGLKVADAFVAALAGAGLTESGQVLAVGAGTGIIVNADDVAIDPSVVVRKYSTLIGNGSATTFNLTHGLGTQVIAGVLITRATDGEVVEADVFIPPAGTTVDVTFAVAPTSSQYRVTVTA